MSDNINKLDVFNKFKEICPSYEEDMLGTEIQILKVIENKHEKFNLIYVPKTGQNNVDKILMQGEEVKPVLIESIIKEYNECCTLKISESLDKVLIDTDEFNDFLINGSQSFEKIDFFEQEYIRDVNSSFLEKYNARNIEIINKYPMLASAPREIKDELNVITNLIVMLKLEKKYEVESLVRLPNGPVLEEKDIDKFHENLIELDIIQEAQGKKSGKEYKIISKKKNEDDKDLLIGMSILGSISVMHEGASLESLIKYHDNISSKFSNGTEYKSNSCHLFSYSIYASINYMNKYLKDSKKYTDFSDFNNILIGKGERDVRSK